MRAHIDNSVLYTEMSNLFKYSTDNNNNNSNNNNENFI